MQTFLPYEDFRQSAESLDNLRLGKQRVENLQIMQALLFGRGWLYHPAVRMWRGYARALLNYQEKICFEWIERGFKDTCYVKTSNLYFDTAGFDEPHVFPHWLGDHAFHISHQSNLVRKDPRFYRRRFPNVPDNLPYIWPV